MTAGMPTHESRRRRRLAVQSELQSASTDVMGAYGVLRKRGYALPSLAPWLPRAIKHQWWLLLGFWCLELTLWCLTNPELYSRWSWTVMVAVLMQSCGTAIRQLFITLCLVAAANCCIWIGWLRALGPADFSAEYRRWFGLCLGLALLSLCYGTQCHIALQETLLQYYRVLRPATSYLPWLTVLAQISWSLFLWSLVRREMLQHRMAAELVLAGLNVWLVGILLSQESDWNPASAWLQQTLSECQTWTRGLAASLIFSGLWLHMWYVAYVNADPPQTQAPSPWDRWIRPSCAWLRALGLWLLNRVVRAEPEQSNDTPEPAEAPARATRKRRRATKPRRRTTRANNRTASDDTVEEQVDEQLSENDPVTNTTDEEDELTSSLDQGADAPTLDHSSGPNTAAASRSQMTHHATNSETSDDDQESYDERSWRVDEAHDRSQVYRGLSKRERKELKRQLKEQRRQRG
ncbi:MAG: hypothetical protein KatS3mg113_0326 [Planctomycetaceae bacterium]|nr:MAG: hypothetical protein KatS3mg113_0326 [Planctomycetaceae bacterium]